MNDKVRCTNCGDVLEGGTYHNMKTCSCGSVSYDWHDIWPRILFKNIEYVEVWKEEKWTPLSLQV